MQRAKLSRLSVLILGGTFLTSCSAAGTIPPVSISTIQIEATPNVFANTAQTSPEVSCENVSISNPAASYCSLLGNQPGTQNTAEGQVSACAFPDGSVCDAWQFLRGKCGQEFSWCALNGFEIQTIVESDGTSIQEYAICVDASGNRLGTVIELSGLQALLDACSRR